MPFDEKLRLEFQAQMDRLQIIRIAVFIFYQGHHDEIQVNVVEGCLWTPMLF